ncbi:hypothetical protein ACGFI9_31335 [Micromonospora sp. NPDC048930]|uniref:hypothetical protein n=1 Tax=Micromonospora sp. NPDC048930 TaxID=3364261 RepID=UPI00371A1E63
MEEVVRRWWNGSWGRLTRRDVWLVRQTRWKVIARAGDTETGRVLRWEYETEQEAALMIDRLLRAGTGGQWREQEAGAVPRDGSDDTSRAPARPRRQNKERKCSQSGE